MLNRSRITPRRCSGYTLALHVSKRIFAPEETGFKDVERHQKFNIWVSSFSDKPIFIPRGMLVAEGRESLGEVMALRNQLRNEAPTEDHTPSTVILVEYSGGDEKVR